MPRTQEVQRRDKGSPALMELPAQETDRLKAAKHRHINSFQMAGSSVGDGKQGI